MEALLKRFMKETDRRFGEVDTQIKGTRSDIKDVRSDIKELMNFKLEMKLSTKWLAILVSGGIGVVSLVASIGINWYLYSSP